MANRQSGSGKPPGKTGDKRRERLSASLRANLRRRKDQMRARAEAENDEQAADPGRTDGDGQ